MLIRSQDKGILVDTTIVHLEYPTKYYILDTNKDEPIIINALSSNITLNIGEYSSIEKALGIISEIQELQEHIQQFQLGIWDSPCFFEKHKSLIYEMPNE